MKGGYVIESDLHAKTRGIRQGKGPYPPIREHGPIRFSSCGAGIPDLVVITGRRVFREFIIQPGDDQHHQAGHDHSIPPGLMLRIAETDDRSKNERHDHIGHPSTEVSPATGDGIGGAFDLRGKHHRSVELGDDEGSADDADRQPEQ